MQYKSKKKNNTKLSKKHINNELSKGRRLTRELSKLFTCNTIGGTTKFMEAIFEKGLYHDFKIKFNDTLFPIHLQYLAINSTFFSELYRKKQQKNKKYTIEVLHYRRLDNKPMDPDYFKHFLKVIYYGNNDIEFLKDKKITDIIEYSRLLNFLQYDNNIDTIKDMIKGIINEDKPELIFNKMITVIEDKGKHHALQRIRSYSINKEQLDNIMQKNDSSEEPNIIVPKIDTIIKYNSKNKIKKARRKLTKIDISNKHRHIRNKQNSFYNKSHNYVIYKGSCNNCSLTIKHKYDRDTLAYQYGITYKLKDGLDFKYLKYLLNLYDDEPFHFKRRLIGICNLEPKQILKLDEKYHKVAFISYSFRNIRQDNIKYVN
jgi:hypothetical protein